MRWIFALTLLLPACSQQPAEPGPAPGTFVGEGRDRLCIAGEGGGLRAGLIAYGEGEVNCAVSGRLEASGPGWVLVPKGEGGCRIPIEVSGDNAKVGQQPAACSYYCGPAATMAGKSFTRNEAATKAVDLAGDPLC